MSAGAAAATTIVFKKLKGKDPNWRDKLLALVIVSCICGAIVGVLLLINYAGNL